MRSALGCFFYVFLSTSYGTSNHKFAYLGSKEQSIPALQFGVV